MPLPPNEPMLRLSQAPPQNDFTTYLPASNNNKVGRIEEMFPLLRPRPDEKTTYSIDCAVRLSWNGKLSDKPARIVACKCFRGSQWSVTIRDGGDAGSPVRRKSQESAFAASPKYKKEYFTSFLVVCRALYRQIFLQQPPRTGLIVVTGATASGKSEITRGLIELRMRDAAKAHKRDPKTIRRPHLITFEDPIEKFYAKRSPFAQPRNFDYTPREREIDAPNLKSVFRDALRQTPTLVFVGEIRNPREWIDVVDFASTGHSVIATAHAGSLAESWGKILAAVGVSTAAGRSDVADRMLGIVHLRSFDEGGLRGALPALWRYTVSGAMAFVADGRSSLLPMRKEESRDGDSSFGRLRFKDDILKIMRVELGKVSRRSPSGRKQYSTLQAKIAALEKKELFERAVLRADLEGL